MKALLLDLDDTLIPDSSGFLAAVDDCAAALGGPSGMGVVLHARARVLWGQAPDAAVLEMRDMSSWEALWAPFPVGTEEWADAFRLGAWHEALAEHGVDDRELEERLAQAYREHRHAACRPYPETVAVLESLRARMRLVVVTNGTEEHQRTKLDASGLTGHFDAIVTSGAVGASKPDPAIFRAALDAVGCGPAPSRPAYAASGSTATAATPAASCRTRRFASSGSSRRLGGGRTYQNISSRTISGTPRL